MQSCTANKFHHFFVLLCLIITRQTFLFGNGILHKFIFQLFLHKSKLHILLHRLEAIEAQPSLNHAEHRWRGCVRASKEDLAHFLPAVISGGTLECVVFSRTCDPSRLHFQHPLVSHGVVVSLEQRRKKMG